MIGLALFFKKQEFKFFVRVGVSGIAYDFLPYVRSSSFLNAQLEQVCAIHYSSLQNHFNWSTFHLFRQFFSLRVNGVSQIIKFGNKHDKKRSSLRMLTQK